MSDLQENNRDEKKKVIIKKIMAVPLERWQGYSLRMGDYEVLFRKRRGGYKPYFEVGVLRLFSEDGLIDDFERRLCDFNIKRMQDENDRILDEFYDYLLMNDYK